jgi:hypothetical protein
MAEERIETREVSWRQLLPWTAIFRGFGVAFDLNKLLLAAAGIFVMWIGWWFLAIVFSAVTKQLPPTYPGDYQRDYPSDSWSVFKRDRDSWNLRHATAGVGKGDQYYEVEDIASDPDESDRVKTAVGSDPAKPNLPALDTLQPPLSSAKLRLYRQRLGTLKPEGRLTQSPWSEYRGPNPYLLLTGQAGVPWDTGHVVDWVASEQFPVLIEPLIKLILPVVYFLNPHADVSTKFYLLAVFIWTVVTWSFFGGAITRIAVVQVARPGEPIGLTEAVRFTYKRLVSYISAPLFPLVIVFALVVFGFIFSIFHMIPIFGDIIVDGFFWFVMLLIGLVMSLALVGLAVAWPLMAPTISAEGTDSWEALSRSFSYVFQRPWHYLWYAAVTVVYGAIVILFVGFMGSLTTYMAKWAVSTPTLVAAREPSFLFVYAPKSFGWRNLLLQGTMDEYPKDADAAKQDPPTNAALVDSDGKINQIAYDHYVRNLNWWNKAGAFLVTLWLGLFFLLILGFGYSFFFSTSTIIYLLMRKNIDSAEMDEVYLEEEDQDAFGGSISPPVPEPPKMTQPLQMVDAPSMRPVTPPTPPPAASFPPAPTPAAPIAEATASAPPAAASPAEPPKDGADKTGLPPV